MLLVEVEVEFEVEAAVEVEFAASKAESMDETGTMADAASDVSINACVCCNAGGNGIAFVGFGC